MIQIAGNSLPLKKITGYSSAEYLLMLTPHPDLWEKIMAIKEAFAREYNHPMATHTKPHLTLLKFLQLETKEDHIIKRFTSVCSAQPILKIELKDFGSLPSHTIHINVTSKLPILNLVKGLKEAQSLLKFMPNFKPHFITDPQITVARQLAPWQYEKAWAKLSHTPFTGTFIATKMTLVKRRVGNKQYVHVKDFCFSQVMQAMKQGNLFG